MDVARKNSDECVTTIHLTLLPEGEPHRPRFETSEQVHGTPSALGVQQYRQMPLRLAYRVAIRTELTAEYRS